MIGLDLARAPHPVITTWLLARPELVLPGSSTAPHQHYLARAPPRPLPLLLGS